jgi:hypothetical protein
MKPVTDPKRIPQTEGHPEPFPEVTTLPKGWDLSELQPSQAFASESKLPSVPIQLDTRAVVQDDLS